VLATVLDPGAARVRAEQLRRRPDPAAQAVAALRRWACTVAVQLLPRVAEAG